MRKLNITPEEMTAVCGRMPACRAADTLGIKLPRFYILARRYSLTTAFTYKHWTKKDDEQLKALVNSGHKHKEIAVIMGRSHGAVRSRVRLMNRLNREAKSS